MIPAIRVDNLGKRYQLSGCPQAYRTIRERMTEFTGGLFRGRNRRPDPETFWALRDVSFEVQPGEVVGIIGRNGSGKSTLLKILSRITRPSHGTVSLRGRVGSLLEVGTGFHPELTGRENIYLNGAILGMRRREIDRKFDAIVGFADMDRFLDTPVKRYSSGMYVRLAFAVAAHLDPEILLVDEVLAVGDAPFQKKCLGKMSEVARGGRTVLLVSHTMAAVQQLCGRALLMRGGQLAAQGPTGDVVAEYLGDATEPSDGLFDLSNHPARPAGCRPLIRSLTLSGRDGRPTTSFRPDDPLQAELVVETDEPVRQPRIALAVEDALGRRIMTAASFFQGEELTDIAGRCRVRCRLPELRLGSGRYLLSVSFGARCDGLLDSLDAFASFDVVWNNNHGNGEAYESNYGPVLTSSAWEQVAD